MIIQLSSLLVDDQQKALKFYTGILGFIKKRDIPMGEHSFLTVVSPEAQDGVELVLEPMVFEPARVFQKALFEAGIPLTSFQVADLEKEVKRLVAAGVEFTMQPTVMGPTKLAVFKDTCGNNIQLHQVM